MRLLHLFGASIFVALFAFVFTSSPVLAGDGSSGNPYTVCASGCDYTQIQSAVSTVATSSYIYVENGYVSSTESWPIGFENGSLTLTCESTDVVIGSVGAGVSIEFSNNSTISGCTLSGEYTTYLGINQDGGSGVTVQNNIIIDADITVKDNDTYIGNTMSTENYDANLLKLDGTGITITNNTLSSVYDGNMSNGHLIASSNADLNNLTITSNTITIASTAIGAKAMALLRLGSNVLIQGNKIKWGASTNTHAVMNLYGRTSATNASLTLRHNTIWIYNYSGTSGLIVIEDDSSTYGSGTYTMDATVDYNIVYWDGTGSATDVHALEFQTDVSGSSLTEDYNVFAGNWANEGPYTVAGNEAVSITSGGNSVINNANPLKHGNASTADDFESAPYAPSLDINGTTDAGAVSGSRESSFNLDDNCTVDYTSCDGTDATLIGNAQSGDTWTLAAGTYDPFTLSASNVTVTGAGASTIIDGANGNTSVVVSGSNSTVSNMQIQDVDGDPLYTVTNMIFAYGGSDYDDSTAFGANPNATFYFSSADGCTVLPYTTDGTDVTAHVSAGNDWHLALVSAGPNKVTMLVPNQYHASAAAAAAACSGFGVSVDVWVTSTFALSEGTFTYDSAAVAAAGIILVGGYTNPPAITGVQPAGITVSGSGNTFDTLTLSNNDWGMYFSGSSANNEVTGVTFTNTTFIDLVSNSTGDNYYNTLTGFDSNPTEQSSGQLIGGAPAEGGGGDAVPEMSTYLLMLTLFAGLYYMYKKSEDLSMNGAAA